MGDPRKTKKRYSRPFRPWDSVRISNEKEILEKYGLRRKREIWKTESILRKMRQQARELQSDEDKERLEHLMGKLTRLNLVSEKSTLDDVLSLKLENLLDRRLQTIVFTKGLANSPIQARQFITHGHVIVGDRKMRFPSFIVPKDLEDKISVTLKVNE